MPGKSLVDRLKEMRSALSRAADTDNEDASSAISDSDNLSSSTASNTSVGDDERKSYDPASIHATKYQSQISIISNNPHVEQINEDPFPAVFKDDISHELFSSTNKPCIRVGVYKTDDDGIRYYDYDDSIKKNSVSKEYSSLSELLKSRKPEISDTYSKRIYFHGHGNGGGDGIGGDHKDDLLKKSEDLTNNDLAGMINNIIKADDRIHVGFMACNYDNMYQAKNTKRGNTNLEHFYQTFKRGSNNLNIELSVSGAASGDLIPHGKVSNAMEAISEEKGAIKLTERGKVIGEEWKAKNKRNLMFLYNGLESKIAKPPFANSHNSIQRKKNIISFIHDALRLKHDSTKPDNIDIIRGIAKDPSIVNIEHAVDRLKTELGEQDHRYQKALEIKDTYIDREHHIDQNDIRRIIQKIDSINLQSHHNLNSNDLSYIVLTLGNQDKIRGIDDGSEALDELLQNKQALFNAYSIFNQYDIPEINKGETQREIISNGARADNGNTLLINFAGHGNNDKVNEIIRLLDNDIYEYIEDKNNNGITALMTAIDFNNFETANLLIDTAGADINAADNNGNSILMRSITQQPKSDEQKSKRSQTLDYILNNDDIDLDKANSNGHTPLKAAVSINDIKLANKLIDKGANIGTQDSNGNTSILEAVIAKNSKMAISLIKKADPGIVNTGDNQGITPLMQAIQTSSNMELIDMLLKAGANPNIGNINGDTPLMYAAQTHNIEVVKKLIDHDANPNQKNKSGALALNFTENHEIISQLKQTGDFPDINKPQGIVTNEKPDSKSDTDRKLPKLK